VSAPAIGAKVAYCGHDGWFLADIHRVGNVNIVYAAAKKVSGESLHRPADGATHLLVDFPVGGFWRPQIGVFVVPEAQVRELDNNKAAERE